MGGGGGGVWEGGRGGGGKAGSHDLETGVVKSRRDRSMAIRMV